MQHACLTERQAMPIRHTCPVPGCGRIIPNWQLMCRGHWGTVRRPLQQLVYSTLGAMRREQTHEACEAYRQARAAAIKEATHGHA
ncbi:MAG: hypothetical protein ABFE02_04645 [Sulfuricella sp.]